MSLKPKKQFVRLEYELLDSEVWAGLRGSSKEAYIYLNRARYRKNGYGRTVNTNGEIEFGHSDCPGVASATFVKAMEDLRIAGLVELIEAGSFQPKRKAIYRLSDRWKRLRHDCQGA